MWIQKREYLKREYDTFQNYNLFAERTLVDGDFIEHTHEFDEIVIVLSGTGEHLIEHQSYNLKRGDVFVMKGDVKHGFKNNNMLSIINLMYDPNMIFGENEELRLVDGFEYLFIVQPEWISDASYPYHIFLEDDMVKVVEGLADFLIDQLKDAKGQYYIPVQYGFKTLISYIANNYKSEQRISERTKILADAIQYIRSNISNPLKISDIAKSVALSSRQLERIFSEEYGISPMEYYMEIRLKHARTLLMNTEKPINVVAEESGFGDASYFARVCKKRFHVSPGQLRNKHTRMSE